MAKEAMQPRQIRLLPSEWRDMEQVASKLREESNMNVTVSDVMRKFIRDGLMQMKVTGVLRPGRRV